MPIPLEEEYVGGTPVLKRRIIGETFIGGIIKFEMRDILKDKAPVLKDDGKPRKELVVYLWTTESTMIAGLDDDECVPVHGTVVRAILKGGGFSSWIDAKKALGRRINVGDVVYLDTTHAVRYSTNGYAPLGELRSADDVAAWERSDANLRNKETLGRYGDLKIRGPKDSEAALVVECEQAWHATKRQGIALDDPFPTAPAQAASDDDFGF